MKEIYEKWLYHLPSDDIQLKLLIEEILLKVVHMSKDDIMDDILKIKGRS